MPQQVQAPQPERQQEPQAKTPWWMNHKVWVGAAVTVAAAAVVIGVARKGDSVTKHIEPQKPASWGAPSQLGGMTALNPIDGDAGPHPLTKYPILRQLSVLLNPPVDDYAQSFLKLVNVASTNRASFKNPVVAREFGEMLFDKVNNVHDRGEQDQVVDVSILIQDLSTKAPEAFSDDKQAGRLAELLVRLRRRYNRSFRGNKRKTYAGFTAGALRGVVAANTNSVGLNSPAAQRYGTNKVNSASQPIDTSRLIL